jgi:hypothetical protein
MIAPIQNRRADLAHARVGMSPNSEVGGTAVIIILLLLGASVVYSLVNWKKESKMSTSDRIKREFWPFA